MRRIADLSRTAPTSRRSLLIAAAALAIGGASCQSARAQSAGNGADAPSLVIALYSKPAVRTGLRAALASAQARALGRWRDQGLLSGYQLLLSRYADRNSWDALEVLDFANDAALASWRKIERSAPGGLDPSALRLVESIETAVTDVARSGGGQTATDPAILVIPYRALVPPSEYLRYLDGYTLPQLRGWIAAGALESYEILMCRYPADRRWNALLILRYRDDAALARRDSVLAGVRARLAAEPAWKAFSDDKKATRLERAVTVADLIARFPAPR